MELIYIVAIACGGLFLVLVLTYTIIHLIKLKTKKAVRRLEELQNMYTDKNLAKMEYDFGVYNGDIEKFLLYGCGAEGQMTIDEILSSGVDDSAGVEEITGNYKP